MLLKVKVYVGNVTNLSDARYCAGMGADMLGFPIGASEGKISPETFLEIAEWVTGPAFVLEYNDQMDQSLLAKVTPLETVQFFRVPFHLLKSLPPFLSDKKLIIDASITEARSLSEHEGIAFIILTDNLSAENQSEIQKINQTIPVFIPFEKLSGQMDKIGELPPYGIVLSGSEEDKPGQKNYDKLSAVFELLETD